MSDLFPLSPRQTALLVSVRSPEEAVRALEGGAAIVDIKEPAHGSLGRAADTVLRDVVQAVGGERPTSAALGEWSDDSRAIPDLGLTYVKWGLAGCRTGVDWRQPLSRLLAVSSRPHVVLTAYADWECAQSPPVDEVFALAREHPGSILLLDTHCKEANNVISRQRPTLLDWLPRAWIEDLCHRSREAHVRIALAGSLGLRHIESLLPARPDWFAVRGAVCEDGNRQSSVQTQKVRQLVSLLHSTR